MGNFMCQCNSRMSETPSRISSSLSTKKALPHTTYLGGTPEECDLSDDETHTVTPHDFSVIRILGVGGFGKVYLVEHIETKVQYAMKVLSKTVVHKKNQVEHTVNERKILSRNSSPFLVKLHSAFQTRSHLYMVMDLAPGGELLRQIRKHGHFSQAWVQFYAAEVALGLDWLHEHGIIYRDLKAENILLSAEGHVLLADFGLCKPGVASSVQAFSVCGTPEYISPEVLRGMGYDKSVDYWGLGVLVYAMLCGSMPFNYKDRTNPYLVLDTLTMSRLTFRPWVSEEAKSLVKDLLQVDPSNRLTSFANLKSHDFFAGLDWAAAASRSLPPPIVPCVDTNIDLSNFTYNTQCDNIEDATNTEMAASGFALNFENFSFDRDEATSVENSMTA